jgi:thiol:disulfide interchange protein DsbC
MVMISRISRVLAMGLLLAGSVAVSADEATVRKVLQSRFPGMPVESITKAPMGLYEVVLDGEILYTDDKAEYFIGGNLYDIRTLPPRNVTQDTRTNLIAKALTSRHDDAIKTVRGNGKRVIYTLEDPNCGYCRELYKEILKLSDVTVYTFLTPILSPDSTEKARAVWCAKDRSKAWAQVMTKGVAPGGPKTCDTPIDNNLLLLKRFGVRGTPAIYLSNGQQIGGYVKAAQIDLALAKLK